MFNVPLADGEIFLVGTECWEEGEEEEGVLFPGGTGFEFVVDEEAAAALDGGFGFELRICAQVGFAGDGWVNISPPPTFTERKSRAQKQQHCSYHKATKTKSRRLVMDGSRWSLSQTFFQMLNVFVTELKQTKNKQDLQNEQTVDQRKDVRYFFSFFLSLSLSWLAAILDERFRGKQRMSDV